MSLFRKIPRPLLWVWIWALAFIAILEIWRPFFFLTDDNLCGYFPLQVATMRRLWHGTSPFYEPNLFGGTNLLEDPSCLPLWSPVNLILSPLALTPWKLLLVDLLAGFNLLLASSGFVLLGLHLRREQELQLSDRRLAFLALSYVFSGYALVLGASWQMFLANLAILPFLIWGLHQPESKKGLAVLIPALLYTVLAGHLHPSIWTFIFVGLYAVGLSWVRGTPQPLCRWAIAVLGSLLLVLPFVIPLIPAYLHQPRAAGVDQDQLRVEPLYLLLTWFFGNFAQPITSGVLKSPSLFNSYPPALAGCFGCGCLLHSWRGRASWTRLQGVCLGLVLLAVIDISRPPLMAALFQQLPVMRSLRWPFREILFLLFFLHVFMMLRPITLPRSWAMGTAGVGAAIWGVALFTLPAPSLGSMPVDRHMIISGEAERFAAQVQKLREPGVLWIAVCPTEGEYYRDVVPWSLFGGFNYPALFDLPSLSGYTIEGFHHDIFGHRRFYSGTFNTGEARKLLVNPKIGALELVSLSPLRITLHQRGASVSLATPELGQQ